MTKSRKMKKGGFWETLTNGWNSVTKEASDGVNYVSQSASSLLSSKKPTTSTPSSYMSSSSTYTPPSTTTSSYQAPSVTPSSYQSPSNTTTDTTTSSLTNITPSSNSTGGKRKRTKKMRGGNYIAETAAPFSGSPTAHYSMVGGKKKTRRHRKKTRSHKKH
jgi:hypothetical protein